MLAWIDCSVLVSGVCLDMDAVTSVTGFSSGQVAFSSQAKACCQCFSLGIVKYCYRQSHFPLMSQPGECSTKAAAGQPVPVIDGTLAAQIARLVQSAYAALPKTGKPQPNEYTVLAGGHARLCANVAQQFCLR